MALINRNYLGDFLSGRGCGCKSSAVKCTACGLSAFVTYADRGSDEVEMANSPSIALSTCHGELAEPLK